MFLLYPFLVSGCTFAPRVADVIPADISTDNYNSLDCDDLFKEVKKIRVITTKFEDGVEDAWSIMSKESNSEEIKKLSNIRAQAKAVQSLIRKKRC